MSVTGSLEALILEGVTGSGKTVTLIALQSIAHFQLISEEVTFDDFLSQFWDNADAAAARARANLTGVLERVERTRLLRSFLLERFHFSQIAVGSSWDWYRDINDRCTRLKCKVAVLFMPDHLLLSRSLYRAEYGDQDWQVLIGRYGSKEGALRTLVSAQALRLEAVRQSGLEYLVIDTSEQAWSQYAKEIAGWMEW